MRRKYKFLMIMMLMFFVLRIEIVSAEITKDEKEQKEIHDLLVERDSRKEKEKVVIGENDYIIEEYQEEKAFKVYNLPFLMLKEYQTEKTFGKIITEDYCWKVPFKTTDGEFGVEQFVNKDGAIKWKSEVTGNMTGEILPEEEVLRKKLEENLAEGESIDSMIYTHSNLYYGTCFVYFHTNKDEYVIPYCPREEWLGLNNGEVYTAAKAMKILNEKFDESRLENIEYTDTMSGIVPPYRQPKIGHYIILGMFCLFAGVFSIIVLKKQRKKSS